MFKVGDRVRVINTKLEGTVLEVVPSPSYIMLKTDLDNGTEVLYGQGVLEGLDGTRYPPPEVQKYEKYDPIPLKKVPCPECGVDIGVWESTERMRITSMETVCEYCGKRVRVKY
jgi:hypothetical protein